MTDHALDPRMLLLLPPLSTLPPSFPWVTTTIITAPASVDVPLFKRRCLCASEGGKVREEERERTVAREHCLRRQHQCYCGTEVPAFSFYVTDTGRAGDSATSLSLSTH